MNAMHCVASEGGRLTRNECNALCGVASEGGRLTRNERNVLCGERRWKVNKK